MNTKKTSVVFGTAILATIAESMIKPEEVPTHPNHNLKPSINFSNMVNSIYGISNNQLAISWPTTISFPTQGIYGKVD